MSGQTEHRIVAVLGPTNTGKTHLAIERMLGHPSGMIGFPLRLLARENYDRIVRERGAAAAALITGEEKIAPKGARYFCCTVEAMPVERRTSFLAIDEIQLCADPERGHVFTDRLLRARGETETMLLGADTIAPLIRRLVPEAEFIGRPRFSRLSYSGQKKLTRLPSRSAVVTFAVTELYALAELIRRRRGGAAVVLGALSPRTRNAQVAMYQAGEVDYLVATDAIGMGLNMDLDHVAFAAVHKFDGVGMRRLNAAELAQVAGRAGRHMNDGTFGVTADTPELDEEIVQRIEEHRFDPLQRIMWRNPELDFASPQNLLRSLDRPPTRAELARGRPADDRNALEILSRDDRIATMAAAPAATRLLWDVCRIPDFRKVMSEDHARLLANIYRRLMDERTGNRLPTDWVANQVERFARTDGDIDTLTNRISHVRTWTYISHRADWLVDAAHWQARTREIEDLLSDALHERLTQRFVDRRTAMLVKKLKEKAELNGAVSRSGDVIVEDQHVGRLSGFRFEPDALGGEPEERRALMKAARRALGGAVADRVRAFERAADTALSLAADGAGERVRICWEDAPILTLDGGDGPLSPRLTPIATDVLSGALAQRLRKRSQHWLAARTEDSLGALMRLKTAIETPGAKPDALSGPARGLAFQLYEGMGLTGRRDAAAQAKRLSAEDRKLLAKLGVRFGVELIYLPDLLKPAAVQLKALLWLAAHGDRTVRLTKDILDGIGSRVSFPAPDRLPTPLWNAAGYAVLGPLALRADITERLAYKARQLGRTGPFAPSTELMSLAGCTEDELAALLRALGYRRLKAKPSAENEAAPVLFVAKRRERKPRTDGKSARPRRAKAKPKTSEPPVDSPFAALKSLVQRP